MKLRTLIVIFVLGIAVNGQATQFRLSGEHVFKKPGAKSWQVSRTEIDPESGEEKTADNVFAGTGDSIKLKLKPSGDKETIYRLTAEGDGFSEVTKVRVFKPWKLSSYTFRSKANVDVKTFVVFPKKINSNTRVLFIMHGLKPRRPDRNMESWLSWTARNNYILVGPQFDEEMWAKSRSYTFGNLFTGNEGKGNPNPQEKWSFRVIEDTFSELRNGIGSMRNEFDMFGHSSGAQFVQRFTFFVPNSRIRLAMAANAGWYTVPDLKIAFPYGLKHRKLNLSEAHLRVWSTKNLWIMRGTKNTKRTANVRQTKRADEQGANRFERAGYMYKMMKNKYPNTNWRLIDAPGVSHSQSKMAEMARKLLKLVNQQNKSKKQ